MFKDLPSQLLSGDDSALTQWFGKGSTPFAGSDDHIPYLIAGALTPAGTERLLHRQKLDRLWMQYLDDIYQKRPVDDAVLEVLVRLGLATRSAQLTSAAFYKLIEASPLNRQVEMLGVELTTSTAGSESGKSTEMHALEFLARDGWLGIHDEGSAFHRMVLMSWMNDVPLLKELLYRQPFMRERSYFMPGSLFIMGYADCVVEGQLAYSASSKAALLDLVGKLTPARLIAGHDAYRTEIEKAGNAEAFAPGDIEKELKLIQYVAPPVLVKIADGMLSGTIPIDGWPDLTMYGPKGLALIEVKRQDKLMFHQARTIHRLSSLVPSLFTSVSIHRLTIK